jgi:hypothetical protein
MRRAEAVEPQAGWAIIAAIEYHQGQGRYYWKAYCRQNSKADDDEKWGSKESVENDWAAQSRKCSVSIINRNIEAEAGLIYGRERTQGQRDFQLDPQKDWFVQHNSQQ